MKNENMINEQEMNEVNGGRVIVRTWVWYEVVSGDCLYTIAQKFGTTTADLISHNTLANPNRIYPGWKIRVPVSRVM